MGFLKPPKPKIAVPEQKAAPGIDDDAVRIAAETEARRAAMRRGAADTKLVGTGGLAGALRQKIGG